jgi:hypothetical protein
MKHEVDYPSCIHDRIYPCTEEEEEVTFARYKTSHMKTEHKEQKAPKIREQISVTNIGSGKISPRVRK